MSESHNYPDFYETPEARAARGPLTFEAMMEGRSIFDGLFNDLMLENIADVKLFEALQGRPTAYLDLDIAVDGKVYSLYLVDASSRIQEPTRGMYFRNSEKNTRSIAIQRKDGNRGRELLRYKLGVDGIVRRWDGGDAWGKIQQDRALGIEDRTHLGNDATTEEIGKVVLANLQNLKNNVIPNARLEEDMGLNNQPVTPEELVGLKDFVSGASHNT